MKRTIGIFVTVSLLAVLAGPAAAADFLGGTLRPSVGVASDHVFRGRSQNDEDPSFNARLDYDHVTGLFGGAEVNTVELGGADAQLRFYGGHTGDIGSMFYVVLGEYTAFPDSGLDLGYSEFNGTVGVDYGVLLLRTGVSYSPDFFADSGDSVYLFSNFDAYLPLGWPVTVNLNGEIGYQSIRDRQAFGANDYYTWNLGVTLTYERFDFDVRYHDTTIGAAGFGQEADARLTAGVTVFF